MSRIGSNLNNTRLCCGSLAMSQLRFTLCVCTCVSALLSGMPGVCEGGGVADMAIGEKFVQKSKLVGTVLYLRSTGRDATAAAAVHRTRRQAEPEAPTVSRLAVRTYINARFSGTVMESVMANTGAENQEANFIVQIPETAFMSNFSMLIDDAWFVAEVAEKGEAEEKYEEAKSQNKTAGMVATDTTREPERGMEYFKVSVNVGANSQVLFKLEYLELMRRTRGFYQHRISIRPEVLVQQLAVDIEIYEPQGITSIEVIEPADENGIATTIADITHTSASVKKVSYSPTIEEQQQMDNEKGIAGDLIVKYDTNHPYDAGLVQFEDDYFVHFFSPNDPSLKPLSKNIVFVIDISGSMSGDKIAQTRVSMDTILGQLRPIDDFMLVLFDDQLEVWPADEQLVAAHGDNVALARRFAADKLVARGGTDLHQGLQYGASVLQEEGVTGANMIVFLTDGRATSGITASDAIISSVSTATAGKVAIFSLGYGDNVDFDLLAAVSYEAGGFAKKIYEGVDATVQLENFFEEVNTPLGYNVALVYESSEVELTSLTRYQFPQYFQGSEIIVAGRRKANAPNTLRAKATFYTDTLIELPMVVDTSSPMPVPEEAVDTYQPGFLEKLYVYMKIKDLLLEKLVTDDTERRDELENFALQLALDYNLVTPLTSMVVVQPDAPPGGGEEDYDPVPGAGFPGPTYPAGTMTMPMTTTTPHRPTWTTTYRSSMPTTTTTTGTTSPSAATITTTSTAPYISPQSELEPEVNPDRVKPETGAGLSMRAGVLVIVTVFFYHVMSI